jgi:PmbA protein
VSELVQLAQDAVNRAIALGASDAEAAAAEGEEFSVSVRMRQVENLKQAGSRGLGIRVLVGQRTGSSRTSDLSPAGIDAMVRSALELAKITTEDPHAGLPATEEMGQLSADLRLYDESISRMETDWKISQALLAEEAALSADPRIENSEGGGFETHTGTRAFVNSRGFTGSYRSSTCGLSAVPVAKQNGSMERDYWYTSAREAARLWWQFARRWKPRWPT